MNMKVDVIGLPHLQARFGKIVDWMNKGVEQTVGEALKVVYDGLPPDPAPSGKSMLPFIKSEKQRRWLMWAITSGELTVPYPRTGEMRRSLKMEVKSLGGSFVGSLGSSSPAALYTIDAVNQARYHKGTWWTLQAEMRKAKQNIISVFAKALAKVLHGN